MNRWLKHFISDSFVVNLITGFVVLTGVLALTSMKRDLIPPFRFQSVSIQVKMNGASSVEMEKYVTTPIEEVLKGLPGLDEITSTSKNGNSEIWLNYQQDFDRMDEAVELVRSRVEGLRAQLPESIRSIVVERDQTNDVFLMFLKVAPFNEENPQHQLILKKITKEFQKIPGVIKAIDWTRKPQIYIEMDPHKLKVYEISVADVRNRIRQFLSYVPLGQVQLNENQYNIEIQKLDASIEDIKNIPISGNRVGNYLKLSSIARVEYKVEDQKEYDSFNGLPSASIVLRKDTSTDSIDLKAKVDQKIQELNASLPDSLKIQVVMDGPHFIEQQLEVLKKNALVGLVFVILLLMLFLNWRTALMTAAGVPIAYMGTLVLLHVLGISIDLISVIGLILVLGILVDDAIIVSEKYVQNLEQGMSPKTAALEAVKDLIVPVTGTVLTTAVAFAPILFLKSEMSVILYSVPVIIIGSLALSWLESFFILPNHLAHFVKKPPQPKMKGLLLGVQNVYKKWLYTSIRYRYLVVALLLGAMGGSGYIAVKKIKHDFKLKVQAERLSVYAILKKSPSLANSMDKLKPIEEYLLKLKKEKSQDVENVISHVGSIWEHGHSKVGYRYAKYSVYLDRTNVHASELKERVKKEIEKELTQLDQSLFDKLYVESEREDANEEKLSIVKVNIKGQEDVDFSQIEERLNHAALKLASIDESVEDPERYQISWSFKPDYKKLAQYGLSTVDVARQARSVFTPDEVMELRYKGDNIYVYTQIKNEEPLKYEDLQDLEMMTSSGLPVPFKYLGHWENKKTLNKISHENGQRNLNLEYKFDPKKVNSTVAKAELQKVVNEVAKEFPTYSLEVEDASKQEKNSRAWAFKVAIVCIGLVLLVMAFVLRSLTQPFLVGMPIPCGLIGIIWALYLHDMPLGVMALIGLVGTVGVAVNASLIMMDEMNKLAVKKGQMDKEVIVEGAASRLRAILLTTLTTLGGVLPMAYGIGGESGFTQPLAFSMGWGLTFATVLTLFVLPSMVEIRSDILRLVHKSLWWKRRHPVEDKIFVNPESEYHSEKSVSEVEKTL